MKIRRILTLFISIFGVASLLTLSPLAQSDESADSILAVSTYDLANDRSQILLLSLAEDGAVSLLHEVLLPLDSGIVAYNYGLSLSPGAQQIVYPAIMAEGPDQLFVYDVETGQNTKLIDDPENAYTSPIFSPDGTKVAFTATADSLDDTDIYSANADGSAISRLTQTPDTAESYPAWSPDGLSIAYTVALQDSFQIGVIPAEGGDARVVYESELPVASVTFSPDGQRLFFVAQTSDELGTAIYSIAVDGDDLRTEFDPLLTSDSAPGIDWLTFTPDGTRLAFAAAEYVVSGSGTMTNQATLRVLSFETGEVDILPWDFGGAVFITGLDRRDPQTLGDDAG